MTMSDEAAAAELATWRITDSRTTGRGQHFTLAPQGDFLTREMANEKLGLLRTALGHIAKDSERPQTFQVGGVAMGKRGYENWSTEVNIGWGQGALLELMKTKAAADKGLAV